MKFDDESDLEKLSAAFARRQRDFDDLQNEMAGLFASATSMGGLRVSIPPSQVPGWAAT